MMFPLILCLAARVSALNAGWTGLEAAAAPSAAMTRRGVLSTGVAIATSSGLAFPALAGRTGDLASAMANPSSPDSWRSSAPTRDRSASGWSLVPLSDKEITKAVRALPEMSQKVALSAATERPFTGTALPLAKGGYAPGYGSREAGVYVSAVSGLPLFESSAKYDSGTGWPSFFQPFDPEHVIERVDPGDKGYPPAYQRIEVLDARSGAHLGHVFDDGPKPTGKRYCMNAAALRFASGGDESRCSMSLFRHKAHHPFGS